MSIDELARASIRTLKPYSSARDEFSDSSEANLIYLDANERWEDLQGENSLNRYPDSSQRMLRKEIARDLNVSFENIFIGNGSDEAIELLIEIFCEPGINEIVITPPTYGMYGVCAQAHGAIVREAPLLEGFKIDSKILNESISEKTKLVFICSPNNPTGNVFDQGVVLSLFDNPKFKGLLVIDEAYVDFCPEKSYLQYLAQHQRLVILRTFSKAWGLAGARVGMALASEAVISLLMKKKPPYNVNSISQRIAYEAIKKRNQMEFLREECVSERICLLKALSSIPEIKVFDSETNFLLMRIPHASEVYMKLLKRGIVVRNRSKEPLCENTLRITVGSKDQNRKVVMAIKEIIEEGIK